MPNNTNKDQPGPSEKAGEPNAKQLEEQVQLERTLETLKEELDETYRGFSEISSELFDTASALETSEKRLRMAAEGAGIGIWDWDVGRDKLSLSASWFRQLGVDQTPAELGWSFWQERIHPDDSDEVISALRKHLKGETEEYQVEHRLKTADGAWNWYLALGRISGHGDGSSRRLAGILLDIHPRKQAEETARLSALRFESIITNTTDGILSLDEEGHITGWNPALAALLDYSEQEVLGQFAGMIILENLQDKLAKGINRVFRGGPDKYMGRVSEAKMVSKGGRVIPVEFSLAAWETEDGTCHTAIIRDITKRKEAELQNKRLRRGLEATGTGTWAADIVAGTSEWDDCSLAIYGVVRDEFSADLNAWEKALHPDDRDKTLKRLADLNAEGAAAYDIEYRIVRPSGEVRNVHAEGTFERDKRGNLLYHSGIHRDITERKEAEEKIRRSEEFLQTLLDTSPVAIHITSKSEGRFLMANAAVGELHKLPVDDLLKCTTTESFFDEKDRKRLVRQIEETGRIDGVDLHARRLGTGEECWLFFNAKLIDYHGQEAILAVSQDITERKEAEELIREARDMAEDATRAKDMFLAAMSHEIRTPMNGVVGMIELLQGTALADDQRRMLETAKDSSFTLLTIINDILDFSKIEAGKMEIEEVAFDLRKAADAVGEMLGSVMAAEKGLPLIVHVQPEVPPMLMGDQVRIRQILFNLAGNAVKFTEEGEVHVGIGVAKTLKDGSVDVVYEIKDSGIGMTEEQLSRLFKPFEQAETSTTRKYGGTGLGLSIVARLSDLMGGKVEVESKPGKGSTFRVTVHHKVAEEARESKAPDLGRIKILALSAAGSRLDLLRQIVEAEAGSLLHRLASETTREEFLAALKEAEAGDDPFGVVYLSADVGAGEQDQLRRFAETGKELKKIPRFLVERHNTPITQDIPGSVLIPVTPFTESNIVRALSILLGKASPDIVSPTDAEGRAAEVPTIEEAEAAGTLILVAEDNKTNQDVIGRQLAVFGYAHEIADDGEIALQMLNERAYGLLLCDVHMPNMDGYQLTQTIRKKEKKSGSRLPIIAATASALQGEGDRCLDVGMDAYMAKPVRMKELRACLEKWLPKGAEETPSEEASEAASSADEGADDVVVDPSVLVEMFGDDELVNSILLEFLPAAWEIVEETENAYAAKDWVAVGDAGHKLKGSACTIGATPLTDICEALEEAGKAGDDKTIKRLMPKLRPAMEAVDAYICGRE